MVRLVILFLNAVPASGGFAGWVYTTESSGEILVLLVLGLEMILLLMVFEASNITTH